MKRIASTTARRSVLRGRLPAFAAGSNGSINAHSRSVRSLGYRNASRLCSTRAVSVQGMRSLHLPTKTVNHNLLVSLNFFSLGLSPSACLPRSATDQLGPPMSASHAVSYTIRWGTIRNESAKSSCSKRREASGCRDQRRGIGHPILESSVFGQARWDKHDARTAARA